MPVSHGSIHRHIPLKNKIVAFLGLLVGVCCFSSSPCHAQGYLDRFTYGDRTIVRDDGFKDYAPQDWQEISCDEENNLDECLAYRDKWRQARDWAIDTNSCVWCPDDGTESCGRHRQSPINLQRKVGLDLEIHPEVANECIDLHWMKYEDSTCTFDRLIETDAFTIERHGLRIAQPILLEASPPDSKVGTVTDSYVIGVKDTVRIDCPGQRRGPKFGRLDYSKGFSKWWYLSHMDLKVPSEHTQDGKRYDAEIQIQHFYSDITNGNLNDMGTVAVLMKAYDDAPPYRFLDKVICQWRRKEQEVRQECGIDPIDFGYPGCFPVHKKGKQLRNLKQRATSTTSRDETKRFQTMFDVIHHNDLHGDDPNHVEVKIRMEEGDFAPADEKDWDTWIEEQSNQMRQEEEQYSKMLRMEQRLYYGGNHSSTNHTEEAMTLEDQKRRKLSINYDDLPYFNYWPMLGVRTEYYFRYQGSQTIPPCYGKDIRGTKRGVNHWR
jgi:hypothetical protein